MSHTLGRCVMGLPQFNPVCHMILSFLVGILIEAVSPTELMIPSLRVLQARKRGNEKDVFLAERCENLEGLDENREETQ